MGKHAIDSAHQLDLLLERELGQHGVALASIAGESGAGACAEACTEKREAAENDGQKKARPKARTMKRRSNIVIFHNAKKG